MNGVSAQTMIFCAAVHDRRPPDDDPVSARLAAASLKKLGLFRQSG
jgi:hypothetical protein